MKTLKDLTPEELEELIKSNEWLKNEIFNRALEDLSEQESDEYNLIGCKIFNYHDHYNSFYLTTPCHYGVKDGLSVANSLDSDYLSEENKKLYDELNAIYKEYSELSADDLEGDKGEELEEKANNISDLLADGITRQLQDSYESAAAYEMAEETYKSFILDGMCYLSDYELIYTDGGKLGERPAWRIKEVILH